MDPTKYFSHLKFARKLGLSFGFVQLMMVLLSIVSYGSLNELEESTKWVNHTYEVIRTAVPVSAAVVDMGTGQRGFFFIRSGGLA
ncbi:MAG: methyl-accepting chemotaxis protein [Alteromonas macleodii]|jgi:methyl-accepting chemotaxis protein